MTERIELGSKAAADQFRDEYADHLCTDDDRRLKTVAISSDAPDHVLETATIEAAAGRSERGEQVGDETNIDDRLADLERAQDEQCGHARDHCEDGEDEACEFLVESCGFDEEDVEALVGDARADDPPGELYGAKNLAWRRYQIAVAEAKEAAAAINELNDLLGEPTTAFRELGQRELTKDDIDW